MSYPDWVALKKLPELEKFSPSALENNIGGGTSQLALACTDTDTEIGKDLILANGTSYIETLVPRNTCVGDTKL